MATLNVHIPYEKIARIAPVMAQSNESMTQVKARVGCDYIINGGTYTTKTRKLDSGIKLDKEYLKEVEGFGLGIKADGKTVEWSYAGRWHPTWIGAYRISRAPDGTEHGKHITALEQERTGMGYTANGILLAATTDKMTTKDFSMKYLDYCTAWINLDGGSSTQWIAPNGKYTTSRKVMWYVAVWLKKQENNKGDDGKMMTAIPLKSTAQINAAFGETGAYWKKTHKGIDLVCVDGSREVLSACDGTVRVVAYDANGWGQYITIGDAQGLIHLYAHLVKGSVLVKSGDKVKLGQQIGTMGSTGNSSGVHLHYQVNNKDGDAQDPTEILGIVNARGIVTPRSTTTKHWAQTHYDNLVKRGVIDGGDTSSKWHNFDASASTLTVGELLAIIDKATK